jgi:hypothetical protein
MIVPAGRNIRATLLATLLSLVLVACGTAPPHGQEDQHQFVQASSIGYRDAYLIIARQMRTCYAYRGPIFNIGFDVQADLDTAAQVGRIETYPTDGSADHPFRRVVVVRAEGTGSVIETSGPSPRHVYQTHLVITEWLEGKTACPH